MHLTLEDEDSLIMNPFVHNTCLFNINVAVHFTSFFQFLFYSNKNENQNECYEGGKLSGFFLHWKKASRARSQAILSRFDKREEKANATTWRCYENWKLQALTSSHLMNFSPSWSVLETSTVPARTATEDTVGALRGLCWFDLGALSERVDVRAAAEDVVNADAAISHVFSHFLYRQNFDLFLVFFHHFLGAKMFYCYTRGNKITTKCSTFTASACRSITREFN